MIPKHVPYDWRSGHILEQKGFEVFAGPFRHRAPWWHTHGGVEIVSVHAGAGQLFYESAVINVGPGDVVIGPAHVPHGAVGSFHRTAIHFLLDLLLPSTHQFIDSVLSESRVCRVSLTGDAARRLVWAAGELRHSPDCDKAHPATPHLIGMVVADIQAARARPQKRAFDANLMAIVDYMRSKPGCGETLEGLADRFRLSRSHITTLFTEYLGVAPGEFWLRLRLEHAAELLRGDPSIRDIAFTVGFQSERGFQRAFARHFGMSPSHYRHSIGNANKRQPCTASQSG